MAIYYFLYSLITAAGILLLSPYFFFKGLRQGKYLLNIPERLGWRYPPELASRGTGQGSEAGAIWMHAVSVGETLAAVPLARALKERFPGRRLIFSTTTSTGQALAHERMPFADAIFYFPLDWRRPVRRVLHVARPTLIIILETEIWPNFLREARREGVPVLFVNTRISDRSFQRLSNTLRFSGGLLRGFLCNILRNSSLYLTQTPLDSERLLALGAPPERVIVAGNMKYDLPLPSPNSLVSWLKTQLTGSGRGPLLVAGSIMAGEEDSVLDALAAVEQRWPDALLILAPRKPDRFDQAAAIVEASGRRVVRRSTLSLPDGSSGVLSNGVLSNGVLSDDVLKNTPGQPRSVLLLDTLGDLAAVYSLADVVFVGGSLEAAGGGHNPLEPAATGKAPVFGPGMANFREIAAGLLSAGAAIEVHSGAELGAAWMSLLGDDECRARMGSAAHEQMKRNSGATAATMEHIAAFLQQSQAKQ